MQQGVAAGRQGDGLGRTDQVEVAVGEVQDQHAVRLQLGQVHRAPPRRSADGPARCRRRRRRSSRMSKRPAGCSARVRRASPRTKPTAPLAQRAGVAEMRRIGGDADHQRVDLEEGQAVAGARIGGHRAGAQAHRADVDGGLGGALCVGTPARSGSRGRSRPAAGSGTADRAPGRRAGSCHGPACAPRRPGPARPCAIRAARRRSCARCGGHRCVSPTRLAASVRIRIAAMNSHARRRSRKASTAVRPSSGTAIRVGSRSPRMPSTKPASGAGGWTSMIAAAPSTTQTQKRTHCQGLKGPCPHGLARQAMTSIGRIFDHGVEDHRRDEGVEAAADHPAQRHAEVEIGQPLGRRPALHQGLVADQGGEEEGEQVDAHLLHEAAGEEMDERRSREPGPRPARAERGRPGDRRPGLEGDDEGRQVERQRQRPTGTGAEPTSVVM